MNKLDKIIELLTSIESLLKERGSLEGESVEVKKEDTKKEEVKDYNYYKQIVIDLLTEGKLTKERLGELLKSFGSSYEGLPDLYKRASHQLPVFEKYLMEAVNEK